MIPHERLREAMFRISRKKGDFTLFGLFLRADSPGAAWDLVVAAPWLEQGKLKALSELAELLSEALGEDSLLEFARVVTLNHDDPTLKAIIDAHLAPDDDRRIQWDEVVGPEIEDAIILQAKPAA